MFCSDCISVPLYSETKWHRFLNFTTYWLLCIRCIAELIGHVVFGSVIQEVKTSNVAREVGIQHIITLTFEGFNNY